MELLDFIDPVELERPEEYYLQSKEVFSKKIDIHTASTPIEDLSTYTIALLGVPEDRNSYNKGASLAPDKIRSELYKLMSPVSKTKIIDLGNLKQGNTYSDTYFALKEVTYQLLCNDVILVVIGGTQELTLPIFQAFETQQKKINISVFDSRIDSHSDALESDSSSYLFQLLLKKQTLFKFTHIGHQTYLTDKQNIELVNTLFHEAIRLGEIRNNIKETEPLLRDTDIVSFDISCIRQSDAPGNFKPVPNGFYSEEACQISRYAGTADLVRTFGVFETNPKHDMNNQTSALVAQMIWHFIDGVEFRSIEQPSAENANFKTFIVGHTDLDYEMTFYKSMVTQRWWLEIPSTKNSEPAIISCSQDDYDSACNHEVPNIWWKNFHKLG